MATVTIDVTELPARFAEVVSLVEGGTDVDVRGNGNVLHIPARPKPAESPSPTQRILGLHAGRGWMADDFDAPLPDSFWLGEP